MLLLTTVGFEGEWNGVNGVPFLCFCVSYLKSIIILKTLYVHSCDGIGELFTPIIHNYKLFSLFRTLDWTGLAEQPIIWQKNLRVVSRTIIEEKAQTRSEHFRAHI